MQRPTAIACLGSLSPVQWATIGLYISLCCVPLNQTKAGEVEGEEEGRGGGGGVIKIDRLSGMVHGHLNTQKNGGKRQGKRQTLVISLFESSFQSLTVVSSLQLARIRPEGSHFTAFTSSV
jgi:hypothetical protein